MFTLRIQSSLVPAGTAAFARRGLPVAVLMLVAALLLGACTPRGLGGFTDVVELTVHGALDSAGPDVQSVTLRAVGRLSETFSFGRLQVYADESRIEPLAVAETRLSAGVHEAVVTLNVRTLADGGVGTVRFVLGGAEAVAELVPPGGDAGENPREDPGADPGTGQNPDPGHGSEPSESEPDAGQGTEPDPGTEPESGTEPDPGTKPDPGTEPDQGADPGPEPDPQPTLTREVRTLQPGTADATDVYIIRSSTPGPTAMIVGGVHGDETSGWLAGSEIKDWEIEAGTLIVLPEAHKQAVDRQRRTSAAGVDLNRQFPLSRRPDNPLARDIWDVVLEFRPDALLDMHEGWGIFGIHDSVGQTLITYPAGDARSFAEYATSYLNTYHVSNQGTYSFRVVGPPVEGSLARKAGEDLGIPAFIAESTAYETKRETRVRWQKAFAEEFLRWYGLLTRPERYVPKAYRVEAQVTPSLAPALFSVESFSERP